MSPESEKRAASLVAALRAARQTVAVAESCTGGLVGGALTSVPGASDVFPGGIVAYSDRVKERELGVPSATLRERGAVSRETAQALARGVRMRLEADWGVGVTGIAGPSGGRPDKPVGTVWIGVAGPAPETRHFHFPGDRASVREATVRAALDLLLARLGREG